jgi:hypothetical protein
MQKQSNAITKSCYFQIRNIGRNRSYTTEDRANTISYVLSWFNLNIVKLIHTLTSDKQVSRRLDIFFQLSSGLVSLLIR